MSRMPHIVLDTLGSLRARGYGLFGSYGDCARRYRMADPPERRVSSNFDIDLAALIAERGADHSIIPMAPVACPRCGGRRTEIRITTHSPARPAAF